MSVWKPLIFTYIWLFAPTLDLFGALFNYKLVNDQNDSTLISGWSSTYYYEFVISISAIIMWFTIDSVPLFNMLALLYAWLELINLGLIYHSQNIAGFDGDYNTFISAGASIVGVTLSIINFLESKPVYTTNTKDDGRNII